MLKFLIFNKTSTYFKISIFLTLKTIYSLYTKRNIEVHCSWIENIRS